MIRAISQLRRVVTHDIVGLIGTLGKAIPMRSIRGPAISLARFLHGKAPLDTLANPPHLAAGLELIQASITSSKKGEIRLNLERIVIVL